MCGANGLSKIRNVRIVETGTDGALMKVLKKTISREMAVLNERDSMSSVTFLIVACRIFRCEFSGATSCTRGDSSHSPFLLSSWTRRQTWETQRERPSTLF